LIDVSFKEMKQKEYLTENEALVYTTLSRSAFRRWARQIGADRKIKDGPRGRVVYLRSVIDKAILEGRR
jgi:hypothetical protein